MSPLRRKRGAVRAERLLDVVVPAYNVVPYLDECLASIVAEQCVASVVIVDDGSTDDTAAIARRWTANDPRFVLIQQENHGLGHARNTGLRHTSARYVAFLDSDDLVAAGAYDRMVSGLETTGSDIATGAVLRLRGGITRPSTLHRGIFDTERTATTVQAFRSLLRDRLASNKVWRRAFLERIGFSYPEGVLYEDSASVIPALAAASGIDVGTEPILLWRERDSGEPSITQDRSDPRHPRDRMSQVLATSRALVATPDLKMAYEVGALQDDLMVLLRWMPQEDDAWHRELADGARAFLAQCEPGVLAAVPAEIRLWCHLLAVDDLEPLADAMADPDRGRDLPVLVTERGAQLQHPLRLVRDVPDEVLEATSELRLRSGVFALEQQGPTLTIEGWAFLDRVAADHPNAVTTQVWLDHPGGTRLQARVHQRQDPRVNARHARDIDVSWSGFTAVFDLGDLIAAEVGAGAWVTRVSARVGTIERSGRLRFPAEPGQRRPTVEQPLGEGAWAHPVRRDDGSIVVRVLRRGVEVTAAALAAGELHLELGRADGRRVPDASFELRDDAGRSIGLGVRRGENGTATAVADLDGLLAEGLSGWALWMVRSDGDRAVRLRAAPHLAERRHRVGDVVIEVRRTTFGNARVLVGRPGPTIVGARWDPPGHLVLELEDAAGEVVVRSDTPVERWSFPIDDEGQSVIPAAGIDRFGFTMPLRSRTWMLEASGPDGAQPVRLDHALLKSLPVASHHDHRDYSLLVDENDRAFVDIGSDVPPAEQGRHHQHLLQRRHFVPGVSPEPDSVFYESYGGRNFIDSPRAIHDRLVACDDRWRHTVEVDDRRFVPPMTARGVIRGSEDHYRSLAQARVVVTNAFMPMLFRSGEGQTTVHTGHGQAYKHMGTDLKDARSRGRRTRDEQRRLAASWDYLISPSPFMSPLLIRTWDYQGTLLETGYPRNDLFFHPDRAAIATRVRERLGLPADKRIVLYAPTFRDDVVYRGFRARLDVRIDLDRASRAFGPDTVLLFRPHYFVVDRLPRTDSVIDVADYPDIQELLLIADVLITDYSSLMFDFAVTGRPMIFFAYDLEHYESTRGVYFDLREAAPGPVVRDSDAVIEAVLAADADKPLHTDRYAAFRARHCPWDDGGATDRVIAAVFTAV